jgi:hypothetical protein
MDKIKDLRFQILRFEISNLRSALFLILTIAVHPVCISLSLTHYLKVRRARSVIMRRRVSLAGPLVYAIQMVDGGRSL